LAIQAQFRKLNALSYQDVWDFQTILHEEIKRLKKQNNSVANSDLGSTKLLNHIVFCEHKPVFTLGKSANADNLLDPLEELQAEGIELFDINRGGDITFHGPGQLTGYLIFDLELLYSDVHRYVRNLEECIIRLLQEFGIKGERLNDFTGVWIVDEKGSRKICAIGVHLSRWVSMHGFGFNVETDLSYFEKIIPCGIKDSEKTVTSLSKELGRTIKVADVVEPLKSIIAEVFEVDFIKFD